MRPHALVALLIVPSVIAGLSVASAAPRFSEQGPDAKNVDQLIADLKVKYWPDRYRAAEALGTLGPAAGSAVPALIDALSDQEALVRSAAAQALGKIGAGAKAAVPDVVRALKDGQPLVRAAAAEALGKIEQVSRALPSLLVALRDQDLSVRLAAETALATVSPGSKDDVGSLLVVMKEPDASTRQLAVSALLRISPSAKDAIPTLIEALKDSAQPARASVATALVRIAPGAKEAVPSLIDCLKKGDGALQSAAFEALYRIGPEGKDAVLALTPLLRHEDTQVRTFAATLLGKIGSGARGATPALIGNLRDRDLAVRRAAFEALERVGLEDKDAPALTLALKHEDGQVRIFAAILLGKTGPGARDAIPALIATLQDPVLGASRAAFEALEKVGVEGKDALTLTLALKHEDPQVRISAAILLGKTGPGVRDAMPALIARLQDPVFEVKNAVFETLQRVGLEGKDAPALALTLKHEDPQVRIFAAILLGKIGPGGRDAIPALIASLQDPALNVKHAAFEALQKIGLDAKDTVTALLPTLKQDDARARAFAAAQLGNLGQGAGHSAPSLTIALSDRDEEVRLAAVIALGKIGAHNEDTIKALIAALREDRIASVRVAAAIVLGKTESPAKEAIQALTAALHDRDAEVQSTAALSLEKFRSTDADVVSALMDYHRSVRYLAKRDLDKAQGTWRAADVDWTDLKLIIKGDKCTPTSDARAIEGIWTIKKLDPSKTPKQVDVINPNGDLALAIYEINDDELKVCFIREDFTRRPIHFDTSDPDNWLWIFKRAKP
jgi:uncharacterized protein (TIGR03067 family)